MEEKNNRGRDNNNVTSMKIINVESDLMIYLKLRSGLKKFKHISEGLNLCNEKNDSTVDTDSEIWRNEQFETL